MDLTLDGQHVTFERMGAFSERSQQPSFDESSERPPTVVFHGRQKPSGKQLTLAIGFSIASFRPTGDRSVDAEGILIEGNPLLFFGKMMMGFGDFVWIKGKANFVEAEMKAGAPVEGAMELHIMKMIGGKPD